MKTEITIDGVTYKVGDVLERYSYTDIKILMLTEKSVFHRILNKPYFNENVTSTGDLKNWKIKKPKKKIVIERWLNIFSNGTIEAYYLREDANELARNRIAFEHFYKEYEIDE